MNTFHAAYRVSKCQEPFPPERKRISDGMWDVMGDGFTALYGNECFASFIFSQGALLPADPPTKYYSQLMTYTSLR